MTAARFVAWFAVLLAVAATVLGGVAYWQDQADLSVYFAGLACLFIIIAGRIFARNPRRIGTRRDRRR